MCLGILPIVNNLSKNTCTCLYTLLTKNGIKLLNPIVFSVGSANILIKFVYFGPVTQPIRIIERKNE